MEPKRPDLRMRHPIQVVSRRTGLSPDVIRAWERRYRAVEPGRTTTKRRLYSEEDVGRLILLRRATLGGRSIGSVAGLGNEELAALVQSDEAAAARAPRPHVEPLQDSASAHIQSSMEAVKEADVSRLRAALLNAAAEMGPIPLLEKVLMPLMEQIGEFWEKGWIRVHQEHMATAAVRFLIESLLEANAWSAAGPSVLVATPSGQRHELGALMVAVEAAVAGCRVTYMGPELPAEEIALAASRQKAGVVALSLVYPKEDPGLEQELRALRSLLPDGAALVVGGRAAASYGRVLEEIGAELLDSLAEFRAMVSRQRDQAGATTQAPRA